MLGRVGTVSLKWETALRLIPKQTSAPPRESAGGKGRVRSRVYGTCNDGRV